MGKGELKLRKIENVKLSEKSHTSGKIDILNKNIYYLLLNLNFIKVKAFFICRLLSIVIEKRAYYAPGSAKSFLEIAPELCSVL